MCVCVIGMCSACRIQKKASDPRNWSARQLLVASGCWEWKQGLLGEQPVLLTAAHLFSPTLGFGWKQVQDHPHSILPVDRGSVHSQGEGTRLVTRLLRLTGPDVEGENVEGTMNQWLDQEA